MTRKDYVAIAEILNNWYFNHPINEHDFGDLVGEFSLMFSDENPRFDFDKFQKACGLIEE